MLILGDKESENETISLRKHKTGMIGTYRAEDLIRMLQEESGQA